MLSSSTGAEGQGDRRSYEHMDEQFSKLHAKLDKLLGAFPVDPKGEPDTIGHRQYHDRLIEAAEAQTQFWRELRAEIAKKSIWAILILLVGLIITGAAVKMGLPPPGGMG